MKDIILVAIVLVVLFLPNLLLSIMAIQKLFVVNTTLSLVLLITIWIIGLKRTDDTIFIPLLLTISIIAFWVRNLIAYKKVKPQTNNTTSFKAYYPNK